MEVPCLTDSLTLDYLDQKMIIKVHRVHSSGDIWAHFRFLIFFWGWLLLNIHCLSKYMVIEEEIIWNLSIYTCFSIISFLLQHQRLGKPKIIFIFTSGKRIFFLSSVIVLSTEWLKCVCYFMFMKFFVLNTGKFCYLVLNIHDFQTYFTANNYILAV